MGTFRITQPGSSVATSLTGGEAVRKHVGILDIKENQFRLQHIPLTQVRSFVIGEISLQEHEHELDPEDPKIDTKVSNLLQEEVDLLVYQAKEKTDELQQAAKASGNTAGDKRNPHQLRYRLQKPDEVLVRLKVEHSGFSTLNNQRFGAKFVGKVANPSDVLLFHRKRQESTKAKGSSKRKQGTLNEPMAPQELEEMNIEDLAKEELENADKKLEILNEQRLGLALDDFVSKEQRLAIGDAMSEMLKKQQTKLIRRDSGANSASAIRETVVEESEKLREMAAREEEKELSQKRASGHGKRRPSASTNHDKENVSDDDMATRQAPKKRTKSTSARTKATSRSRSAVDSDSDEVDEVPAPASGRSRARPRRQAVNSQAKYTYGSDSDNGDEDSDAVVDLQDDDDDDDIMEVEVAKPKKRGRAAVASSRKKAPAKKKTPAKQSQLSFMASKRGTAKSSSRGTARRKPAKHATINLDDDDSDDDNAGSAIANSLGMAGGWGTAPTQNMN